MVRLPDGRRRSIPRSITDLAAEPFTQVHDSIEQSLRISVRTLLPLAHFLTARSTSLEEIGDERAASPDADALDHAGSGAVGAESAPAPALEEALRDARLQVASVVADMVKRMATSAPKEQRDVGDHDNS
jgi:hypothetical protein